MNQTEVIDRIPVTKERPPRVKEKTASILALIIVCTFAISMGLCFVYLFFNGCGSTEDTLFKNTVELVKTFSAALSGPLGFVLGYYFTKMD